MKGLVSKETVNRVVGQVQHEDLVSNELIRVKFPPWKKKTKLTKGQCSQRQLRNLLTTLLRLLTTRLVPNFHVSLRWLQSSAVRHSEGRACSHEFIRVLLKPGFLILLFNCARNCSDFSMRITRINLKRKDHFRVPCSLS